MGFAPSRTQLLVALALALGIYVFAGLLAGDSWGSEPAPFPYMWRDVALVHFLAALPLAWVWAGLLKRRLATAALMLLAVFVLALSLVPVTEPGQVMYRIAVVLSPFLGVVYRALAAFGLALSTALIAGALSRRREPEAASTGSALPTLLTGIGVAVLLLLPATYLSARCKHDMARLTEMLDQSRFGEARRLAYRVLILDPEAKCKGHPMTEVAMFINQQVQDFEARVAAPLEAEATTEQRLERATLLAMLDKTNAAVAVLKPLDDPRADNLRGAIHRTKGDWQKSVTAFQSAKAGWEAQSPSEEQQAELERAVSGIAYGERKLGNYTAAEAAYQELLILAPTADSHFLLAQFYEDCQQANKAQVHARAAMTLDPQRYQQRGEKLINKLMVYEFGCLGVFNAERERTAAPAVPAAFSSR